MMGSSTAPGALPKLVTYSRRLADELAATLASWADWKEALAALARVAAVTGRTPVRGAGGGDLECCWIRFFRISEFENHCSAFDVQVWPDPLCASASPWIGGDPGSEGRLPLRPNLRVVPYGPLDSLRCIPQEYINAQV